MPPFFADRSAALLIGVEKRCNDSRRSYAGGRAHPDAPSRCLSSSGRQLRLGVGVLRGGVRGGHIFIGFAHDESTYAAMPQLRKDG